VALAWLALSAAICWLKTAGDATALLWLGVIWCLAITDLGVTALAMRAVFQLNTITGEKRPAAAIQALTWGLVKLACLG
jgi:hypothetical protein